MVHARQLQLFFVISLFSYCGMNAIRPPEIFTVPKNFYEFIGLNYDEYKAAVGNQLNTITAAVLDAAYQRGYRPFKIEREYNEAKAKRDQLLSTLRSVEGVARATPQDPMLAGMDLNETRADYAEAQEKFLAAERAYEDSKAAEDERKRVLKFELAYKAWGPGYGGWKDKIARQCKTKRADLNEKTEKLQELLQRLEEPELSAKRREYDRMQWDIMMARQACSILMDDKKRYSYDLDLDARGMSEGQFGSIRSAIMDAKALSPDMKVGFAQLIGNTLAKELSDIPGPAGKIFNQNIALKSVGFLPVPSDVQYGIGFSGLLEFNKFNLRVSVYIVQSLYGKPKFSIAVELPDHYKISDLIPGLTYLDAFSFPRSKLVFSTFAYGDQGGAFIEKGVNFAAEVDLSGPLQILSDLKEKSKYSRSFVFDNKPVVLSGVIPPKLLDAKFSVHVPFYFGVDLTKVSAIPSFFSSKIKQVTTDEFRLEIAPRPASIVLEERRAEEELRKGFEVLPFYKEEMPPEQKKEGVIKKVTSFIEQQKEAKMFPFTVEAEVGARIVLGTQLDPIKLTLLGMIKPSLDEKRSSFFMTANLKNMLQLKWFALGDAAVQFGWEAALMEQAKERKLPWTDIGVKGRVDLGKPGESRAHFNAAGGFRLASKEAVPDDWLLSVDGKNIRFADLIQYISYLASQAKILKTPFELDRIPTMTFHRVWGEVSLADRPMRIGKTLYYPGVTLQVETELFNKKFGFKVAINNAFRLSGFGYIPRFDVSIKNRELFKLYGLEKDKGPKLAFSFDPKEPSKGYFNLNGTFEIPAMRVKQAVNFLWHGWQLDADFESKIAGLAVIFGVSIDLKAGEERLRQPERGREALERRLPVARTAQTAFLTEKSRVDTLMTRVDQLMRVAEKEGIALSEPLKRALETSKAKYTGLHDIALVEAAIKERIRRAGQQPDEVNITKLAQEELAQDYKDAAYSLQNTQRGLVAEIGKRKEVVELDPGKKWRQMYVRFGFKDDFAEYMTTAARGVLQKMRDNAYKKLEAIAQKMNEWQARGIQIAEQEIASVRQSIAQTEEKIRKAKEQCAQARWYKKLGCAKVLAQQSVLAAKKSYLQALVKPKQAIARGVRATTAQVANMIAKAQSVRRATEAVLDGAITGLDMIKQGLTIFRIREAIGEYSSEDAMQLKSPRLVSLVVEVNIPIIQDEPSTYTFNNLQFDFKDVPQSVLAIAEQVLFASQNRAINFAMQAMDIVSAG